MMTAEELLILLDGACLGSKPEQSIRRVSNHGRGFWLSHRGRDGDFRYISTHVDADLCAMADVIERARVSVGMEARAGSGMSDTAHVERVKLLHCALGGDMVQRRCHTGGQGCGFDGCNVKSHYCDCPWQTWERVDDSPATDAEQG